MSSSRIGDLLVKANLINEEQLAEVLSCPDLEEKFIGTVIVEKEFVGEDELVNVLSQQYGVPVVELDDYNIDEDIMSLIPKKVADKHGVLPVVRKDNSLTVAVFDPSNIIALNEIKFLTGLDIQIALTSEAKLKSKQERLNEQGINFDEMMEDMGLDDIEVIDTDKDINLNELEKATEDAPVVKLVNAILTDAIKRGCSDIHIEPYEKSFRVRFRIDGVLHEIMRPPLKLKNALTSRLKIMASLDISERRLPQDGRIKLKLADNGEMDYRVNVLPTLFGEKVVLRLLDKSNLQLDMTKLGFYENQLKEFLETIHKPHGMVLVTGPTGSGKTTTLYSALAELNKIDTNISTAEDPVEFNLNGINQAQMHEDIGFNFASALRAFLRQDPDIIMVGEIRDYETAEIAIKASLTGHLVLSTLHTNSAPATVSRLLNMGVEPFLVASSLNMVIAQRLARRICSKCVTDETDTKQEALEKLGFTEEDISKIKLKKGAGCDKCSNSGYKGRIALYEVMTMTDELKEYVLNGASTAELAAEAENQGMISLRKAGLLRLQEGVTTIEEILRVTISD